MTDVRLVPVTSQMILVWGPLWSLLCQLFCLTPKQVAKPFRVDTPRELREKFRSAVIDCLSDLDPVNWEGLFRLLASGRATGWPLERLGRRVTPTFQRIVHQLDSDQVSWSLPTIALFDLVESLARLPGGVGFDEMVPNELWLFDEKEEKVGCYATSRAMKELETGLQWLN